MKEYSPKEENALNRSREISDKILIKGGATRGIDGSLHVTDAQISKARKEMMAELNKRVVHREDGDFESFEKKVFDPLEIQLVIAGMEKIQLEDIIPTEIIVDNKGNTISMIFRLREESAYSRYGKLVDYSFVIQGRFHANNPDFHDHDEDGTEIWKHLYTADAEEKGLDYVGGGIIAKFDGEKWVEVETGEN